MSTSWPHAQSLAQLLEVSFGPFGLDQLCRNEAGHLVMTSKGSVLLETLEETHPTARALLEAARDHGVREGDGTSTLVLMATAALLKAEHEVQRLHCDGGRHRSTAAKLASAVQLLCDTWLPNLLPLPLTFPLGSTQASTAISALIACTLQHKHDPATAEVLTRLLPPLLLPLPPFPSSPLAFLDSLSSNLPVSILSGAPISQSVLVEGILAEGSLLPRHTLRNLVQSTVGLGDGSNLRARIVLKDARLLVLSGPFDPLSALGPSASSFVQSAPPISSTPPHPPACLDLLKWRKDVLNRSLRPLLSPTAPLLLLTSDPFPPDLASLIDDLLPSLLVLHQCDAADLKRITQAAGIAAVPTRQLFASSSASPPVPLSAAGKSEDSAISHCIGFLSELQFIATSPTSYRALLKGLRPPPSPASSPSPSPRSSSPLTLLSSPKTLLLRCASPELGQQLLHSIKRALRVVQQSVVQIQHEDVQGGGGWAVQVAPGGLASELAVWYGATRAAEDAVRGRPVSPALPAVECLPPHFVPSALSILAAAAARPLAVVLSSGTLDDPFLAPSHTRLSQDRRRLLSFSALRKRLHEASSSASAASSQAATQSIGIIAPSASRVSSSLAAALGFKYPQSKTESPNADLIVADPKEWALLEPANAALRRFQGAFAVVKALLNTDLLVPVTRGEPEGRVLATRREVQRRARRGFWSREEGLESDSGGTESDSD